MSLRNIKMAPNVKSTVKILSTFVASLENTNFKKIEEIPILYKKNISPHYSMIYREKFTQCQDMFNFLTCRKLMFFKFNFVQYSLLLQNFDFYVLMITSFNFLTSFLSHCDVFNLARIACLLYDFFKLLGFFPICVSLNRY
mgnify:CR=1 FL=1